jgi:para-nitrobenzyl esterase
MAGVEVLIGTTDEEAKLFAAMDPSLYTLDEEGLGSRVEALVPGRSAAVIAAYRAAREARGEPVTPFEIHEAIMTDSMFRAGAMRLAEIQSARAPVYAYLFNHRSPALGGLLGACHALELPFVFGTYRGPGMADFVGEGPGIEALSLRMQDAWLAFARTGNPGHEGLPAWPRYDPARRTTMVFGPECRVEDAPREPERAALAGG